MSQRARQAVRASVKPGNSNHWRTGSLDGDVDEVGWRIFGLAASAIARAPDAGRGAVGLMCKCADGGQVATAARRGVAHRCRGDHHAGASACND